MGTVFSITFLVFVIHRGYDESMLYISIVSVGTMKNKDLKKIFDDYVIRLSPYARVRTIELRAEPFRDNAQKIKAKKAETARIIKELEKYKTETVVILSER